MKKVWFYTAGQFRIGGQRIEKNLLKFMPSDYIQVSTYEEADFIICHMQMKADLDRFVGQKKPMIFLISEIDKFPNAKEYYDYYFQNECAMTYTFHPLEQLGYKGKNHIRGAWGVDTEVFNVDSSVAVMTHKPNTCIAFGFYDSENYNAIYQAVRMSHGKMLHLDFKYWDFLRQGLVFDSKYHKYKEYVSDEELKQWYLSCKFVSGLRGGAGFEVPILEGMLMGARPICFDSIYYDWFRDFALYVPEGQYERDLTENLLPIFNNYEKNKVTKEEINYVRDKFGWQTIATNFWKEVMRAL